MNFRFERPRAVLWGIAVLGGALTPNAFAQMLPAPGAAPAAPAAPALTGEALAARLSADADKRLEAGRDLLDAGDPRSVETLRAAAQGALQILQNSTPADVLNAAPASLPDDELTASLTTRAAQAHLLWSIAAQKFARRDEAITALARAQRLLLAPAGRAQNTDLERDINLRVGELMTDGLPLVAPDDVLGDIALLMHGGQWTPRSWSWNDGAGRHDFLVTDGELFPPPPAGTRDIAPRTPGLYQKLSATQLPSSLKLNKMVAGYARENSGPNQGQWRQVVRVFYASPRLTAGKRDDLPRARALAQQFLKVHALEQDEMGLSNLYAQGDREAGVTTLWLLEVSALWPNDDDDPRVIAQLGPLMPIINTGKKPIPTQPETTALMRPWTPIAGQNDADPDEILFWKAGLNRSEAEWLRELFHEYGHVAIPPLGGFRPPLEPFANGVIGETLGMMWAAQMPESFELRAQTVATNADGAPAMGAEFEEHLKNYALPARAEFLAAGPNSPLADAGTAQSLRFLNGATTYLERVYGGPLLGRALQPLAERAGQTTGVAARRALLRTGDLFSSIETNWSTPWNPDKTLPIWLPGALGVDLDAATLVNRAPYTLKAGTRAPLTLWVPPGTAELRIEGAGAGNLSTIGPSFSAKGDVARVFFGDNGWQKITLVASANATISAARFIRK